MKLLAVITTVGSVDDARRIASALVGRGLVACAQISAIESHYVWQGALRHEPEWRLLLKTTAARHTQVVAALRELHPYELPAIHALALDRVDTAYADWIAAGSSGLGPSGPDGPPR